MAQEYGAAQPIFDVANKAYDALDWADKKTSPPKKVDTSWHDKMVSEANESFRKAADKERGTTLKSSGTATGSKPKAKTPRKPSGRKR